MKYLKYILFSMMLSLPAITMATDEVVNINTASATELMTTLTSMDKKTAQAIVAYREKNGPFATKEALLEVEGVRRDFLNINKYSIVLEPESNS